MLARPTSIALVCVAALAVAGLAACGEEEPGIDEPAREGLALPLGGVEYNVFITRQLNLGVPPDNDYYHGEPPKPGNLFYGIFLEVCNKSDGPRQAASRFVVKDNQGEEFEPIELPEDNAFAYHSRVLQPRECIPEKGSSAQLGPTAGTMLLFEFPLQVTENRPLELEVFEGGSSAVDEEAEHLVFELDL